MYPSSFRSLMYYHCSLFLQLNLSHRTHAVQTVSIYTARVTSSFTRSLDRVRDAFVSRAPASPRCRCTSRVLEVDHLAPRSYSLPVPVASPASSVYDSDLNVSTYGHPHTPQCGIIRGHSLSACLLHVRPGPAHVHDDASTAEPANQDSLVVILICLRRPEGEWF